MLNSRGGVRSRLLDGRGGVDGAVLDGGSDVQGDVGGRSSGSGSLVDDEVSGVLSVDGGGLSSDGELLSQDGCDLLESAVECERSSAPSRRNIDDNRISTQNKGVMRTVLTQRGQSRPL